MGEHADEKGLLRSKIDDIKFLDKLIKQGSKGKNDPDKLRLLIAEKRQNEELYLRLKESIEKNAPKDKDHFPMVMLLPMLTSGLSVAELESLGNSIRQLAEEKKKREFGTSETYESRAKGES